MDKKDKEYGEGHRELAAENATAFAFQVISQMDWDDIIKPTPSGKTPSTYNDNRKYDNRQFNGNIGKYVENDNRHITTDNYFQNNEGIINIGIKKKSPNN